MDAYRPSIKNKAESAICDYLESKHVFVLSVASGIETHSAPLFFKFDRLNMGILFQSSEKSLHSEILEKNPDCSGCVFDETRDVSRIRGIQFQAVYDKKHDSGELKESFKSDFPESDLIPAKFYYLQITSAKMTDNTVSFGHKRRYIR